MLSPYRVLDVTDDRGEIAGMLLGDLGADVVRVEPTLGVSSRHGVPRVETGPAAERGLTFRAYNRNKRGLALDLASARGREEFLALASGADFVLESWPPGTLAAHGIDFEALRAANPRVVHVKITPYGSDGPYAELPANDLTLAAMGGPLSLQGEAGRPPVRVSIPQVWRHAGAEAAVAALVAHRRMLATGEAQEVDVSAQCVMTWTMLNAMVASAIQGDDFERSGSAVQTGVLAYRVVFECRDGHMVVLSTGETFAQLIPWMKEDGDFDPAYEDVVWVGYDAKVFAGQPVEVPYEDVVDRLAAFILRHDKKELLERGLRDGITLAPVNTLSDLLEFEHLQVRDYWRPVRVGDRTARSPGVFAKVEPTPLVVRREAPGLDEHGDELRTELRERPRTPAATVPPTGAELPLAGLKVVDFSWIGVGPISGRALADHGATVIRIESESRIDRLRANGPFKDRVMGINRSHFFGDFNASKQSLALDLKSPEAAPVARRLLEWADVVIESFTPGAMTRLGLGYETARTWNPSLVMVSTCLMGQTGPARGMAGYGYHAGAVAGFYEIAGWPDLPPSGPWMAYTDTIAPRLLVTTLLAAIDHRRRTGEGSHIDAGQMEMALHFLAPELLDLELNGFEASRVGNRGRGEAPQGVFPTAGDDQWIAIGIDTDGQWDALRSVMGDPEWARDARFADVSGRLAGQDALEGEIADWTRDRDGRDLMAQLSAAGVPAGVVQRSSDLLRDPQIAHRGFHRYFEHPEMGNVPYSGSQYRIADYQGGARGPAPMLGEHSFDVLQKLLGYEPEEIASLMASGAVG